MNLADFTLPKLPLLHLFQRPQQKDTFKDFTRMIMVPLHFRSGANNKPEQYFDNESCGYFLEVKGLQFPILAVEEQRLSEFQMKKLVFGALVNYSNSKLLGLRGPNKEIVKNCQVFCQSIRKQLEYHRVQLPDKFIITIDDQNIFYAQRAEFIANNLKSVCKDYLIFSRPHLLYLSCVSFITPKNPYSMTFKVISTKCSETVKFHMKMPHELNFESFPYDAFEILDRQEFQTQEPVTCKLSLGNAQLKDGSLPDAVYFLEERGDQECLKSSRLISNFLDRHKLAGRCIQPTCFANGMQCVWDCALLFYMFESTFELCSKNQISLVHTLMILSKYGADSCGNRHEIDLDREWVRFLLDTKGTSSNQQLLQGYRGIMKKVTGQ